MTSYRLKDFREPSEEALDPRPPIELTKTLLREHGEGSFRVTVRRIQIERVGRGGDVSDSIHGTEVPRRRTRVDRKGLVYPNPTRRLLIETDQNRTGDHKEINVRRRRFLRPVPNVRDSI